MRTILLGAPPGDLPDYTGACAIYTDFSYVFFFCGGGGGARGSHIKVAGFLSLALYQKEWKVDLTLLLRAAGAAAVNCFFLIPCKICVVVTDYAGNV